MRCVFRFVSPERNVCMYVFVHIYLYLYLLSITLRHYPRRRNNTPNLDVRYMAFYSASIFDRVRDRELDFRLDCTVLFAKR